MQFEVVSMFNILEGVMTRKQCHVVFSLSSDLLESLVNVVEFLLVRSRALLLHVGVVGIDLGKPLGNDTNDVLCEGLNITVPAELRVGLDHRHGHTHQGKPFGTRLRHV